ncbi:MAG: thioredoxin domain-containing protein [Deltaproteobacteria bacterium]|nr:thioredoxin domain-containing protein [bacterium]MCB9476500.1 thioredoxin domain-containing protein [Deltaproteobacteria bacterium]MCB9478921.1 thioredoxin domain-containing protein [Deltaproteobacteria bacterium]MCB9489427.1 thioredoxin domain-containing protein [Deltaproteobacteria bacterium]
MSLEKLRKVLPFAFAALVTLLAVAGCQSASPEASPTPAAAATPAPSAASSGVAPRDQVGVELFVMSDCPFGRAAEGVLYKASQALPGRIDLDIKYIVDAETKDGETKFQALHGPSEIKNNRVQTCIGLLQPDKQLEFIDTFNTNSKPWDVIAEQVGVNVKDVEACLEDGRGDQELIKDAATVDRMGINASPTMFVGGEPYQGPISSLDLFEFFCEKLGDRAPDQCASPPDTLSRSDGATAGQCSDAAAGDTPQVNPEMIDPIKIEHWVVYPADAFTQGYEQVVRQTATFFPNAEIKTYSSTDKRGKELIEKYHLDILPAFIFPKKIEESKNFTAMGSLLVPMGSEDDRVYVLSPTRIGANYHMSRPKKEDEIGIYYTPYTQTALAMLLDVISVLQDPQYAKFKNKVQFRPSTLVDQEGKLLANNGPPEIEELERHIAIMSKGMDAFQKYLVVRHKNPVGTYWEDYVREAGLNPDEIKTIATSEETESTLKEYSQTRTELGMPPIVAFFVQNREVAFVQDKDQFIELLKFVEKH